MIVKGALKKQENECEPLMEFVVEHNKMRLGRRARMAARQQGYDVSTISIRQPVDHANPSGPTLPLHGAWLQSPGVTPQSPVLLCTLGEQSLARGQAALKNFVAHYGADADQPWHILVMEHRGYGASVTDDEDQSRPDYVTTTQAALDYGRCIDALRDRLTGPYIAAGWSYGGMVMLKLATQRPDDVRALLLSSTPTQLHFMATPIDAQVRRVWGEDLYDAIAKRLSALQPKRMGDTEWMRREFLQTALYGTVLFPQFASYLKYVRVAVEWLPTTPLYYTVRGIDKVASGGFAWEWSRARGKTDVRRDKAGADKNTGYTFAYQQAAEVGLFFASPPGRPQFWAQTRQEYDSYCKRQFGLQEPVMEDYTAMLENLRTPSVFVAGGLDPCRNLYPESSEKLPRVNFIADPRGQHDPDMHPPDGDNWLSRQVRKKLQAILDDR